MPEKKKSYRPAVFFILGFELCERFNYYGMRAILAIYMKTKLGYSDDSATMGYHVFLMMCYFFPIFGAILADNFIGKYRTIFYISIVYAGGCTLLSVASSLEIGLRGILTITGLLLIAIGSGGIKPCVVAFGGNQFNLPEEEKQLKRYFSFFYFSINVGSMISIYTTPIMKSDVSCSADGTCYPLAFGVPGVLMITATVLFLIGRRWYEIDKPEGNVLVKLVKCMGHALRNKWNRNKEEPKKVHWLEYSDDKYDTEFINDGKQALSVLKIFAPVPLFWALYDQQGSRWAFQAQAMYGGFFNDKHVMEPEQMQVFNPFLILFLIPIFQFAIYPLFNKFNLLVTPLQKFTTGGFVAALSFVVSAVVELGVEPTYANIPKEGKGQLRLFNALNCPISITSNVPCTFLDDSFVWTNLDQLDIWQLRDIPLKGSKTITLHISGACLKESKSIAVDVKENAAKMYMIDEVFLNAEGAPVPVDAFNELDKSKDSLPRLGILYKVGNTAETLILKAANGIETEFKLNGDKNVTSNDFTTLKASLYELSIKGGGKLPKDIKLRGGGVYILTLIKDGPKQEYNLVEIVKPNTFHMMWQIPQIILISIAEIMFSITGLEFAFTQAPASMQAVIQSAWLLTTAIGSAIVAVVSESRILERQMNEFLLFAGLMVADVFILVYMAAKYIYIGSEPRSET